MIKKFFAFLDKHGQWKAVLGTVVIVAVFALFGFRAGGEVVRVVVEENDFVIRWSEDYEERFLKEKILSVDLTEEFDFGEPVDPIAEGKYLVGTWNNTEYGPYSLAVKKSTKAYVLAETVDGVYVFNYENEKQTRALYDALMEWWKCDIQA